MSTKLRLIISLGLAILFGGIIILKETRGRGDAGQGGAETGASNVEAPAKVTSPDRASAAVPGVVESNAAPPVSIDPASLPRLVDLGSHTCVPCKLMEPILEELKSEYANKFSVEFIDTKKNRPGAALYGIRIIPTQIFFDANGDELFRHEGFISKEAILAKWLELGVDIRKQALPTAM